MTTKLPIARTVGNSFSFVVDNLDQAKAMLLPIIPYMIAADFLITFGVGEGDGNVAIAALSGILYFVLYILTYCAILIVWHRTYLNGPSDGNRVDIMTMTRVEWEFVGKFMLLGLVSLLVIILMAALGGGIGAIAGALVGLAFGAEGMKIAAIGFAVAGGIFGFGAGLALSMRFMLYFPAKATGNYMSFRESFRLSKGLGWRLMVMNSIPGLLIGLVSGMYAAIMTFIFHSAEVDLAMEAAANPDRVQELEDGTSIYTLEDGTTWEVGSGMGPTFSPEGLIEFIMYLPMTVLLPALCTMVVANTLSQTYRWVVENRR